MIPSDLGRILTAYLKKVFEFFIETKFTANLEATLDEASGNEEYEKVLNNLFGVTRLPKS